MFIFLGGLMCLAWRVAANPAAVREKRGDGLKLSERGELQKTKKQSLHSPPEEDDAAGGALCSGVGGDRPAASNLAATCGWKGSKGRQ
jgi:hypothetical protein